MQNNHSAIPCPIEIELPGDDKGSDTDLDEILENSKYQVDPEMDREFRSMTDKRKEEEEQEKVKRKQEKMDELAINPPDPHHGFRCHSWVLVFQMVNKVLIILPL